MLLGKRCIERIENKFRLSAVVQYWLISTAFGFVLFRLLFTLDPKIVHSIAFRALRYFLASILFDILLQIERFLAFPPREKVLECIQNWISFERDPFSAALHACICFVRESRDLFLSDYSTSFDRKKIF